MQSTKELLFDLPFYKGTFNQAFKLLSTKLSQPVYTPKVVVTPNVDYIVKINNDSNLFNLYKTADYFFADGFPLVIASKLLSKPLAERITGADMFPALCSFASQQNLKVFILGGHPDDHDVHKILSFKYPGAVFQIYSPPMDFQYDGPDGDKAAEMINDWIPDLVFCCLGASKGELWALSKRSQLKTKLILCVGAALDFATGKACRAPLSIQVIGFEWMWRLCSNPARLWKRYFFGFFNFAIIFIKEFRK